MSVRSRRSFLKTASASAAVVSLAGPRLFAQPSSSVKVWSTFRDRRHTAADSLTWKPAGQVSAQAVILNTA